MYKITIEKVNHEKETPRTLGNLLIFGQHGPQVPGRAVRKDNKVATIKPIIIAKKGEPIKFHDYVYDIETFDVFHWKEDQADINQKRYRKVLALPDSFSQKQVDGMIEGTWGEGEVFVECEKQPTYAKSGQIDDNGNPILEGSIIRADGYGSKPDENHFYCVEYYNGEFGSCIYGDFDRLSRYQSIEVLGHVKDYMDVYESGDWTGNMGAAIDPSGDLKYFIKLDKDDHITITSTVPTLEEAALQKAKEQDITVGKSMYLLGFEDGAKWRENV